MKKTLEPLGLSLPFVRDDQRVRQPEPKKGVLWLKGWTMRNYSGGLAAAALLALATFAASGTAYAQERPLTTDEGTSGAGIRSDHITATGQTVPNPGAPQSSGTTDLDRGIQRENNKIQSSICKGC